MFAVMCCCLPAVIHGQTIGVNYGVIKGRVVDAVTGEPVGDYILSFSCVGYQSIPMHPADIKKAGEVTDIGTVKLKEGNEKLQEVVVKPLMQQTASEIVYNLDQDPDRERSSLYELIDRVPMIAVRPDGRITVGDQENGFLFVRNGKKDVLSHSIRRPARPISPLT